MNKILNRSVMSDVKVKALAVLLATACVLAPLPAAVVVNWSGDYVSTPTQSLALPSPVLTDSTNVYAYSSTNTISPTSGYVAPADRSGPFYGGAYLTRSAGSATFGGRSVSDGSPSDRIFFQRSGSLDVSFTGAAFIAFQTDSFLNVGLSDTVSFGLDGLTPVGSLSMSVAQAAGATHRFAVLNAGQWYLSSASLSGVGTLAISSANILSSTWGAWSPTSGANGRLGDVPVSFSTLGSAFTDIEGFGYYVGWSGGVAATINSGMDGFSANALVVPEPEALALVVPAWIVVLLLRRKRGLRS